MGTRNRVWGAGLVGVGLLVAAAAWGRVWAEEPVDLSAHFGFLPVEIFKLQERSQNLIVGDFTNDNRLDLALVDNSNNRLDLLVQRDKPDPAAKIERKINQFENCRSIRRSRRSPRVTSMAMAFATSSHSPRPTRFRFDARHPKAISRSLSGSVCLNCRFRCGARPGAT